MKGSLGGLLAVIAAIVAIFSFYKYTQTAENTLWLVLGIVCAIATLGFGAMFFAGRVNKTEDIHITE